MSVLAAVYIARMSGSKSANGSGVGGLVDCADAVCTLDAPDELGGVVLAGKLRSAIENVPRPGVGTTTGVGALDGMAGVGVGALDEPCCADSYPPFVEVREFRPEPMGDNRLIGAFGARSNGFNGIAPTDGVAARVGGSLRGVVAYA